MNISGGAYIVSVKPGSLADDAGLVGADEGGRGDVVVAANGKPVANPQDLLGIVKTLKSGEAVVLKFLRIAGQDENRNIVSVPNFTSIIKP
jgi:S1-C subfamily serine protease